MPKFFKFKTIKKAVLEVILLKITKINCLHKKDNKKLVLKSFKLLIFNNKEKVFV